MSWPNSLVDDVDVDLRHWARDVYDRGVKLRRAQPDMRIIRETETLFWESDEIAIQFVILVLVVNRNHAIIARAVGSPLRLWLRARQERWESASGSRSCSCFPASHRVS